MEAFNSEFGYSRSDWESCLKVLQHLKDDPFNNPDNQRFGALITKVYKTAKKVGKGQGEKNKSDIALIRNTEIAKNALENTTNYSVKSSRNSKTFKVLNKPKKCYCCHTSFYSLHFFYHKLCPKCADRNYQLRFLPIDLSGRNIILTGGRVKIGFATALKVLRSHGNLTITTRFPAAAFHQFKQEKDFTDWQDRLEIFGLDLRSLAAVNDFIEHYAASHDSLDVLINNAAQTIRYDEKYYQPLIHKEQQWQQLYAGNVKLIENKMPISSGEESSDLLLAEESVGLNRFGQPVDFREKNSWNSRLTEVPTTELLEVNLINHISPYLLIKELTPLLKASTHPGKFIINVTSSEGQFDYPGKTICHPHTNMTKAALNMLTRTSAKDYARDNIYMNSVDVGWVSTGAHEALRQRLFAAGQIPPLDAVDGAARILHPIYETIHNKSRHIGRLLKNYEVANW